jgi:hypothetical protein
MLIYTQRWDMDVDGIPNGWDDYGIVWSFTGAPGTWHTATNLFTYGTPIYGAVYPATCTKRGVPVA